MRRLFTTLLALFLLVAVVADANARNRRRSSGTVYYSTPYVVAQDGQTSGRDSELGDVRAID